LSVFNYEGEEPSEIEAYERRLWEILQDHNSTLSNGQLSPADRITSNTVQERKSVVREKIDFFFLLNKWGREQTSNPETSLEDFLELLRRVNNSSECWTPREKNLSLLFGLLREQPVIWSKTQDAPKKSRKNKGNKRKRKRDES
jgi:hypothetical protein